ncbi:MAG: AbrB/MazE/SpoVT family DNA-binding domain-containing protein [Candidatus Methanoperedens sp.]
MRNTVTRKIQYQNGSYFSTIPGAFIDAIGLKSGDKVSFGIEDRKIIITPASPPRQTGAIASTQPAKEVIQACQ